MNSRHRLLVPLLSIFFLLAGLQFSASAAAPKDSEKKAASADRIDLNSATAEQLKELPGVGDVTAAKIIANRPYSSTRDLSKAGLTENQIEKISPRAIAKRAATPAEKPKASGRSAASAPAPAKSKLMQKKKIDLNTASLEELQTLPGIGPVSAQRIIDNRPFKSVKDLNKVGLPAGTVKDVSPMVSASRMPAARKNMPQPTSTEKRKTVPAGATERVEKAAPPAATERVEKEKEMAVPSAEAQQAAKSGKVWLNTESNIFHRSGDRFYGTTRSGKFVSEEEAIRAGARESK